MTTATELRETFACFGSECTVIVAGGEGADGSLAAAKRSLLDWHRLFSRFNEGSELSRLNADPRATVPVSPMLRRLVEVVMRAARDTGGLVDATLLEELEAAGYDTDLPAAERPLAEVLDRAPARAPAAANPEALWQLVAVDRRAGTVTRPPGCRIDSGGLAKGLFADELAASLANHDAFVVDCCGDIRLGGTGRVAREVRVASPFDDAEPLHVFELAAGGVATSGIGRRAWVDAAGRPAHHLLDPATGRPAFTGVVQVTALARTAVEAEIRSKAALLSGPEGVYAWLPHGGFVVLDDGAGWLIEPA
jgi:thiamine biosynthesis lipoprotein